MNSVAVAFLALTLSPRERVEDLWRFPSHDYAAVQRSHWRAVREEFEKRSYLAVSKRESAFWKEQEEHASRRGDAWEKIAYLQWQADNNDLDDLHGFNRSQIEKGLHQLRALIGEKNWAAGQIP